MHGGLRSGYNLSWAAAAGTVAVSRKMTNTAWPPRPQVLYDGTPLATTHSIPLVVLAPVARDEQQRIYSS